MHFTVLLFGNDNRGKSIVYKCIVIFHCNIEVGWTEELITVLYKVTSGDRYI